MRDVKARFVAKTKEIHRAVELQELKQFNVHRSQFAKMRAQKTESEFNERTSNENSEAEQDQEENEDEEDSSPTETVCIR